MNKEEWERVNFGRLIEPNEIVFDVDNREWGFHGINFTGINLANAGYKFEIWYSEGGKSPHLHTKNIYGLDGLTKEQLQKYKELFLLKYCPQEYRKYLDLQVAGKHRIAEENKPHYKYKTIKKLCGVWNEDKENFAEQELLEEAKKEEKIEVSIDPNAVLLKDKIKIMDIARKYGVKKMGTNWDCPFHKSTGKKALSLSNSKGVFYCFGCGVKGDIITFVRMLEDLKNG